MKAKQSRAREMKIIGAVRVRVRWRMRARARELEYVTLCALASWRVSERVCAPA